MYRGEVGSKTKIFYFFFRERIFSFVEKENSVLAFPDKELRLTGKMMPK